MKKETLQLLHDKKIELGLLPAPNCFHIFLRDFNNNEIHRLARLDKALEDDWLDNAVRFMIKEL